MFGYRQVILFLGVATVVVGSLMMALSLFSSNDASGIASLVVIGIGGVATLVGALMLSSVKPNRSVKPKQHEDVGAIGSPDGE